MSGSRDADSSGTPPSAEQAEAALRTNERRMRAQKEAFQAAINGAPLAEALKPLAGLVAEELAGEARTAFYAADAEGAALYTVRGAGDMPDAYADQIDGFSIGLDSLACGLSTATGRPVVTRDVFEEPLWAPWLRVARDFDHRGCWSFPIDTRDGRTVGTFALYFRTPREPAPHELALADLVTQTAAIIIARHTEAQERARAETALRASEERLRQATSAARISTFQIDVATGMVELDANILAVLYGLDSEVPDQGPRAWESLVQAWLRPEAARRHTELLQATMRGEGDLHNELLVRNPATGAEAWIEAQATLVRDAARGRGYVIGIMRNVTERKRTEEALRESEERQAFLLELSDALRPLADAREILSAAVHVLGRHLGASRVAYAEHDPAGEAFVVFPNYADGVADGVGRYRYADYGPDIVGDLGAGRTRVQPDIANDGGLTDAEKAALAENGVGALLNVPLVKGGQLVAFLGVNYASAHEFSSDEIELVAEVADRTWAALERARAEAALRESEEKYRNLFEWMGQGYSLNEVVRDPQGAAIDLRHLELNRAFERLTGASLSEARGRLASEVFPGLDRYWVDICDRAARTGVIERVEHELTPNGRWYQSHFYPIGRDRVLSLYDDITDRKRAEIVLRESEERQAFLLRLSDETRPLLDPVEIQEVAMRLLAEQLDVMRATYYEVDPDEDGFTLTARCERDAAPIPERMRLSDFAPDMADAYRSGRTLVFRDTEAETHLGSRPEAYRPIGVRAWAAVPLVKEGRLLAIVGVHSGTPRDWTEAEVHVLEDVAERTWSAVELLRLQRHADELNAFLVRFSDAVRGLADARAIAEAACRMLAEELGVERAYWSEVDWAAREYVIGGAFQRPGVRVIAGRFPVGDWEPFTSSHLAGRPVVVDDTQADARIPPEVREGYAQIAVGADLAVPVLVDGQLRCTLAVNQRLPRRWAPEEVALVGSVAGRCWAEVERARAEAALTAQREQRAVAEAVAAERQALLKRIVHAQEEERRYVAHEIHDSVTQLAHAASLRLDNLVDDLSPTLSPAERRDLERARDLTRSAAQEARRLIAGLRPETLDQFGLVGALQAELHVLRSEGWNASFRAGELASERLPEEVEISLYRVAQEALTNVRKHAGKTSVQVALRRRNGEVRLVVHDRGRGFEPTALRTDGDPSRQVGLVGMRERVEQLGGRFALRSAPDKGTRVEVALPITPADGAGAGDG